MIGFDVIKTIRIVSMNYFNRLFMIPRQAIILEKEIREKQK